MIESAQEFYRLRKSSIQSKYYRAAHDEAPLGIWLEVIKNYPDMRFWVAHNKTVPVEILEILATDEDVRVRAMVAQKRKLPERLQVKLAKDPHFSVRQSLVYNAKITKKTLDMLLQDTEQKIKKLAENKIIKHSS